ncbi:MAG: hypothetical protein KA479_09455 [Saprospiraceae bacterium]|nr:hypothetical protein [Saprospiraceae bacterium]
MNPFANLTGILLMILMMVGLFYVAKGVFWLLTQAAIFLIAGAIIIHYPTVIGFFKWLWNTWKKSIVQGLIFTALTALLYPVVCALLFFRALLNRKVAGLESAIKKEQQGEFVDFEELESAMHNRKKSVRQAEAAPTDRYSDLFE